MKTSLLFAPKTIEMFPQVYASGFAGDRLMVTHLLFAEGAVGARHSHPHEQMTIVLKGEIEFTLCEETKLLKTGEAVAIPSNIVHGLVALTETELLDIFTPVRDDLIEKLQMEA